MEAKKSKFEKLFEHWISTRKTLIADSSGASRKGLAKSMIGLGAKMSQIILVSTYEEAEKEIEKNHPDVVITDYEIGPRCGLDLLQAQRENNPDTKKALFVLVTGNTSQSAVAQAAEEDVDTFILKPYTVEVLRNSILQAALRKINPSDYTKKIEAGKEALFEEGNIDKAMGLFEEAIGMDPKPSLALFYHGQAHMMKEAIQVAQDDFSKGLTYNKIHYKCLTGLYDILLKQKQYQEAYDVVKRISRYFPANPQRLSSVLRLAIMTESYEDVERYYQIFINLDTRNDQLVKYICAALVVCGKFYLQNSSGSRALELFQKAGVTAAGRPKILKEIILSLVGNDLSKEALSFLARFPADTKSGTDYLAMELLIQLKTAPIAPVVEKAQSAIQSGHKDPIIYKVLIEGYNRLNKGDSASRICEEAAQVFPEQAAQFQELLQSTHTPETPKGD